MPLTRADYEVNFDDEAYDFPNDVVLFAKRALAYTGDRSSIGQYLPSLANDKTISFRIRAVLNDVLKTARGTQRFVNDADFLKVFADAPFITNMCESLLRNGAYSEDAAWAFKSILNVAAFEKNNFQY
jgi:hypothetical protein